MVADQCRAAAVLAALTMLVTGCERDSNATASSDSAGDPPGPTTSEMVMPEGFDRTVAQLRQTAADDPVAVELDVWFAGDPEQWHQGLTSVTDLDGADGMLFAFETAAEYRFYMWQTPMPLDIYFFAADGHSVGSDAMEPCLGGSSSRCARYSPGVPFLLALEVPSGSLASLAIDETWTMSFDAPGPDASHPDGMDPDASGPPTSPPADR